MYTQTKVHTTNLQDLHDTSAQFIITLWLLERRLGYFNALVALKRIINSVSDLIPQLGQFATILEL